MMRGMTTNQTPSDTKSTTSVCVNCHLPIHRDDVTWDWHDDLNGDICDAFASESDWPEYHVPAR
jgi:hypothetical protein